MEENTFPKLNSAKDITKFLSESTIVISETLTGVLASDTTEWKFSAGRIVQSLIKGKLFTQLGRELTEYREAGKIKEDYFASNKTQATLKELLKFIDDDAPDDELFKAMKSIFFKSIKTDATQADEFLAYEFLQTAKRLCGTEVLILKATYESKNTGIASHNGESSYQNWANTVAQKMGYGHFPSLIEKYDNNLTNLKLLSNRTLQDYSGVRVGQHFRLTDLGVVFCEFIMEYP